MQFAYIAVITSILLSTSWGLEAKGQEPQETRPAKLQQPDDRVSTQNGTPIPETTAPISAAGTAPYSPLATMNPQTLHEKLMTYSVATYGPRALVTPAIPAGFIMAFPPTHYPREWRQGASAFGRVYGDELARTASTETARFAIGALLHEDFRYRPSDSKNALARTGHAILFTFVDRSDSGHARPALANFAGAAAGGYVPNAYLPRGWNDVTHADIRTGERMGGFVAGNVLREFEPELFHLVKKLRVPFPRIPVPEWWIPLKGQQP